METGFKYAIAPGGWITDSKDVRKSFRSWKRRCWWCLLFLDNCGFQWFGVMTPSVLCTGTVFHSIPIFLCVYAKNLWEVASFSFPRGTQASATWVGLQALQLPFKVQDQSFKDPVETFPFHFPLLSHSIWIVSLTWTPVAALSFPSSSIWACCCVLSLHSPYSSSPPPSCCLVNFQLLAQGLE